MAYYNPYVTGWYFIPGSANFTKVKKTLLTCGAPAEASAATSWAAACTTLQAAGKILWAAWKFNCNSEVVCEGEALRLDTRNATRLKGWRQNGLLLDEMS